VHYTDPSSLIKEMDHLRKAGCIHPLPFTEFDISTLNQAFLHLSKADHVGKVVVGYKPEGSMVKQLDVPKGAEFCRDAIYVLVGGLRGVGRSVVHWMVSRGARKIAIFNRSGSACREALSLVGELAKKGADLKVVKCDVTIASEVESAMDTAATQGPIKGILHAAAIYKDGIFSTLPYERWKLPLSVKVQGSINLHDVAESRQLNLDFFVMISSIEAVVALPSQAAYCAGNCFQDAFARYRRSIGRPATSIAFGLIGEISEVGQWASARGTIARNGLYPIGEYDLLRLLEGIFAEKQSHHADVTNFDSLAQAHIVCCLDPEELAKQIPEQGRMNTQAPRWHSDAKFSHTLRTMTNYLLDKDVASEPEREIPSLASEVDCLITRGNREEAVGLVTSAIIEQAASLLGVAPESVDSRRSIAHYGVDSLLGVELRNWMTNLFHDAIPLLKLLDETISIKDLGEMILVKQERS
jgi:NADP-dependent 3-hydroxy acid dehydrogenase YdfG